MRRSARQRRARWASAGAALLALVIPAAASAKPGELDTSFGDKGAVHTRNFSKGTGIALLRGGGFVALGQSDESFTDPDPPAVYRYLADGSLDTSFGINGRSTLDLPYAVNLPDVAVDTQGRMLILGEDGGYPFGNAFVIRLRPDGQPDPDFGDAGVATLDLGAPASPLELRSLSDGGILIAGSTEVARNRARYLSAKPDDSGQLDGGYGDGGVSIVAPKFHAPKLTLATSAAISRSGEVLLAGDQGELALLGASGAPKYAFGDRGRVKLGFDPDFGGGAVAFGDDHRLFVADEIDSRKHRHGSDMAISSYRPNGKPDGEFAKHGFRSIAISKFNRPLALEPQADGKVVLAGITAKNGVYTNYPQGYAFLRMTKKGKLDDSYGHRGVSRPGLRAFDLDTTMLPNGKILGIGTYYTDFDDAGDDPTGMQIFRLLGDGRPAQG